MALQQTIGQTLRAFRQRKGLTQKELASKIQGEVDYSYIGKIERGEQLPALKLDFGPWGMAPL
jgi:transcriptional regulator with XRE-family HTH domain